MAVNDIREGFGSDTPPEPSGSSSSAIAPPAPANPDAASGAAPEPSVSAAWSTRIDRPSLGRQAWLAWRRWLRGRPFWAGLLITLAGAEILVTVKAPLPVVLHVGLQGLAAYLVPTVIVLCGLLLWFSPDQRIFYSILTVLMSLLSWITSNLGGFFVGMLLGLVGGSLAFAWSPNRSRRPDRAAPPAEQAPPFEQAPPADPL